MHWYYCIESLYNIGPFSQIPPLCTGDWSDRGTLIPGWNVVIYPQPGDIIAYSGVPGIVVDHNTSITVFGASSLFTIINYL